MFNIVRYASVSRLNHLMWVFGGEGGSAGGRLFGSWWFWGGGDGFEGGILLLGIRGTRTG